MNQTLRSRPVVPDRNEKDGKGVVIPSCARASSMVLSVTAGLLALVALVLWWAQVSPAYAQTLPDQEARECITKVLGSLPASLLEMTDEQRRVVIRDCPSVRGRLGEVLRGQQQPPAGQQPPPVEGGATDEALRECLQKALGKVPANLRDMTAEQRRIAVRACPEVRELLAEVIEIQPLRPADQQQPPLGEKQPPVVSVASNEELLECLRKALGKLPASLGEVTAEQMKIAVGACPEVKERLDEVLGKQAPRAADTQQPPVVSVASNEELLECLRKALGKLPASLGEVTAEQMKIAVRACPEVKERLDEVLGKQAPRPADTQQPPAGQQLPAVAGDTSNKALWECIRKALGYLPASLGEVTVEQMKIAVRACPEVKDRLGEVLSAASAAATQKCIQNILQRVPGRAEDVTEQEKERIRVDCFSGGASVPGQPAVAGEQPATGQSISGEAGSPATDAFQQLLEQQLALMQEQQRLEQVRIEQEQERLERERQDQAPSSPGEGQPAEEGPRRGFFTNSAAGEANAVDKLMDPSTLAVLGILMTLLATSLSLLKGN